MLRNKAYNHFDLQNEKMTRPKSTAELASLFVTDYKSRVGEGRPKSNSFYSWRGSPALAPGLLDFLRGKIAWMKS